MPQNYGAMPLYMIDATILMRSIAMRSNFLRGIWSIVHKTQNVVWAILEFHRNFTENILRIFPRRMLIRYHTNNEWWSQDANKNVNFKAYLWNHVEESGGRHLEKSGCRWIGLDFSFLIIVYEFCWLFINFYYVFSWNNYHKGIMNTRYMIQVKVKLFWRKIQKIIFL